MRQRSAQSLRKPSSTMTVTRSAKATPSLHYVVVKVDRKLVKKLPIVKKTSTISFPHDIIDLTIGQPKLARSSSAVNASSTDVSKSEKLGNYFARKVPRKISPPSTSRVKQGTIGLATFKLKKVKDPALAAAALKKVKSANKNILDFNKLEKPKVATLVLKKQKNEIKKEVEVKKPDKTKHAPREVKKLDKQKHIVADLKKAHKSKPLSTGEKKPDKAKPIAAESKQSEKGKAASAESKKQAKAKSSKSIMPPLTAAALKKLAKQQLTAAALKKLEKECSTISLKICQKKDVNAAVTRKSNKRPLTAAELRKLAKLKKMKANIPQKPRIKKPKEWDCKGSDWSGNSDDEGSVDFALLDEDLCYECGLDTTDLSNWESLILCDSCDGEYHIACVHLDRIPRNGYTCPRCTKEDQELGKLAFTIPKKKRGQVITRCYSPSRPLEVAFEECKRKGFMLVSRLFSYDLMRQLTHGFFQKLTSSGRVADCWEGATSEISKRLGKSSHNLVDRQGRFDLTLPEFVVDQLKLKDVLEPLLALLRSIMSVGKKKPELRTHNIVFVPVGSQEQIWHVDDCLRNKGMAQRYFTVLIQLNSIDENCGGTEVWSKELCRGDLIRGRPGDAFVFPGSLLHRGRGNEGNSHRFFYYASFSSETDNNE